LQLLTLYLKVFVSLIRELVMGDIRLHEGFWEGLKASITRLFQPCSSNAIMEHADYERQRQEIIKQQIKPDKLYTVIDQKIVTAEMKKNNIDIGGKACGNYISFIEIIQGKHLEKFMDLTE